MERIRIETLSGPKGRPLPRGVPSREILENLRKIREHMNVGSPMSAPDTFNGLETVERHREVK
jgi:hypothetical protein